MNVNYDDVVGGELTKWENDKGKPAIGKVVEGVLINYEKKNTTKGEGNIYEVRTKEGILAFFAPMLLHKKLQNVAVGDVVRIELTGVTKTNGGNELKQFKVGHAKATPENLRALGIDVMKDVEDDDGFDGPKD